MATILIVDDLSIHRDVLVTILKSQGHRLVEARDGREGLEAVRADHPDLVITDVLMPVMDGYEFVRQLRRDPATAAIPVLFYTAYYGEREARELARSSGVAGVLTKPVESKEALRIVDRLLSGDSSATPAEAPSPMSTADCEHLQLLSDELSEKADDLKIANARLRALINIGMELASVRDSDLLLRRVSVATHDLFGATYVTIGLVDSADRTVQRYLTWGADTADWVKIGDAVPGILARVVTERRTMRGENPGGEPAGLQLPALHPPVEAFLAAPIASPSNVYGWICLVANEGRSFTAEDERLFMALAAQVGRMFENLLLLSTVQKRTASLEHEVLERQQAESARNREHDRAQRYLDTAEVILLALDLDGRITLINRHACDLLEWSAGELQGRNWVETCLPARMRTALSHRFQELIGGDLSVIENPVVTRSGKERLIEWRNRLLRDEAGNVTGTFSSGADVTERQHAVEALRTGEERMRFALENAGVGIWDMDYATGVVRWSGILEAQYGLQPGTFGGTFEAFIARIHPDDRASVAEIVGKAAKSGTDFTIESRTILPDGSVRWLAGAGRFQLGGQGEPVRGVGISQDVTERRTLEAQYQQAQKMEAIGQLASGVAHDFNNLLTVILGFGEIVTADVDSASQRGQDLDEIVKAARRAEGLTRQLLAFSRQQVLCAAPLDLNALVADMTVMLDRLIGEDIQIVRLLAPQLSPVLADRSQLEQVVMNLVVNARDAMPRGGLITIETRELELDHTAWRGETVVPGPYVVLSISDTGTGMSPEVQRHLFEPFFTTKGVGKGTGLGLSSTYGIVKQSRGHIWVDSALGHGTTFTVHLPRFGAVAAVEPAVSAVVAPFEHASETVLLVEDEIGVRRLSKRILDKAGYRVLEAVDGDDAVRVFNAHPNSIDVVVTDVIMPGCGGPELLDRLHVHAPDLPVVYMSGYTEQTALMKTVVDRGLPFIQKPFTAAEFVRQVRRALDRLPAH